MRQAHHFIALAALVAGVLTADNDANATRSDREYVGAGCYRISAGFGTESIFAGTISNPSSTDDMTVMCPLSKMYSHVDSAFIVVYDRNTTLNISCTLYTEYSSGSQVLNVGQTQYSTGFNSNYQILHYSPLLASGDYYYAICTIPRVDNGQYSHVGTIEI